MSGERWRRDGPLPPTACHSTVDSLLNLDSDGPTGRFFWLGYELPLFPALSETDPNTGVPDAEHLRQAAEPPAEIERRATDPTGAGCPVGRLPLPRANHGYSSARGHPSTMPDIHTAIDIDAPPEAVWEVLTDTDAYPEWNPHVVRFGGTLAVGERATVTVRQSGRENSIGVRVTECDRPHRLEWVGKLGLGALFLGTHAFELEPLDGGERTRFVNTESSRGVLAGFVVEPDAREAYEAMNAALKSRVEGDAETEDDPEIIVD